MRRSRNLFHALLLGMLSLGFAIGALFPMFMIQLGFLTRNEVHPSFVFAALAAGLAAGGLNFLLAASIVRPRLRLLATRMQAVRATLRDASFTGDRTPYDPEQCSVPEHGSDELGVVARNYNALLRGLHEARQIEARIQRFSQALSSELDLGELGVRGLDLLIELAAADGGALLLERQGTWSILASRGMRGAEQLSRSPVFLDACREGERRRVTLPQDTAVDAVLWGFRPEDTLIEPIRHNGIVLGWLVLAATRPMGDELTRLISTLLQGLGLALNNALLYDDLQRVAALDPLTGVYNRGFGMRRLEEELARAERAHGPVALLIIDIDHFKNVNDTFGHVAGDRVLVIVSQVCRDVLREGDLLMRYGGEEFMAILPGASLADANSIAERVRFAIASTPVETDAGRVTVTASIGVAVSPGGVAVGAEAFIGIADSRLYAAKAGGRDRVMAGDP